MMERREQTGERFTTICLKTPHAVDLLHTILTIDGKKMEICGLAKQTYAGGLLCQWWIAMDA